MSETKRTLERISTVIPWPRGLVFDAASGRLIGLARGRPRGAGGPDAQIDDEAGTLYSVDPNISEQVDLFPDQAGPEVVANGRIFAAPTSPPFYLWDKNAQPPVGDIETDRPYAGLASHPRTGNFFVACFSGIDIPPRGFRKNGRDNIHRYFQGQSKWFPVEAHDATVIPLEERKTAPYFSNEYYPHHEPADARQPPHGFLNGPDGLYVYDDTLYAAAKDNHLVVAYDLSPP